MCDQRCWRGILQFCRRDVAGGKPCGFRQFEDGLMIFFMNIDPQRAVIAFTPVVQAVADAAESVT
jgi:hypothetical protein